VFNGQPTEASEPMSDYRSSLVNLARQRQADRQIEFWVRAFVAFMLAFTLVALYYLVRHN
jgi:hypothetical protein